MSIYKFHIFTIYVVKSLKFKHFFNLYLLVLMYCVFWNRSDKKKQTKAKVS